MTRRLLLTYLTIAVVGLAVLVIPLGQTFASRERDRLRFDIERDATVVASLAEDALEAGTSPVLDPVLDPLLAGYGTGDGRIVVVNNDGLGVYDTDADTIRDFSSRPEIIEALDGQRSDGTRFSETLGYELMYVAVPVASGGTVHGAVRISYPTSTLDRRIDQTWYRLAALSAMVVATVASVGWFLARSVTEPVRAVRDAATAIAEGDLTRRAPTDVGAPELRELASTFNQTAATLEELLAAQRAFVADASHQLRTPLTALRLRLENLEPALEPAEQVELAAAIAETDRLARLVDGLLTLARADDQPAERAVVDASAVIDDRLALWAPQAAAGDVVLVADTTGSAPVRAVPGALEQILDNFISNAIAASPPDTTIGLSTERTGGDLTIHVIDQGQGLSPEARQRAFDRFWRAPGARGKGSGLGLAIVAELATTSGGRASLENHPDGGLDATVRLPLAPPQQDPDRNGGSVETLTLP